MKVFKANGINMCKMAKCGMYKYSFCTHKHNACECSSCLLVQRRTNLYKWIDGHKYKKCPHCGEYKPMSDFKANSQGNKSWCYTCQLEYAKKRHHLLKEDAKPIVKVTQITFENTFGPQEELNLSDFKKFCKSFIEEYAKGIRYVITKL